MWGSGLLCVRQGGGGGALMYSATWGVMWVALELSGTFAVNSDFLLPWSYYIMRTYDEIPRMLKL